MHVIEWSHDRQRIVLPVLVLLPSPSTNLSTFKARALLDTGSTASGITARVAQQLGLVPRGKRPLGSAQGEGQVERYLFRIGLEPPGDRPQFPFVFDDVVGFELKNSFQFDALIGMDILRQCDFVMDRSRRCTLRFG